MYLPNSGGVIGITVSAWDLLDEIGRIPRLLVRVSVRKSTTLLLQAADKEWLIPSPIEVRLLREKLDVIEYPLSQGVLALEAA